jgi:hypothetical protein
VVPQKRKDRVRVRFTARGGRVSEPFSYTVADRTGVPATEDVSGCPKGTTGTWNAVTNDSGGRAGARSDLAVSAIDVVIGAVDVRGHI